MPTLFTFSPNLPLTAASVQVQISAFEYVEVLWLSRYMTWVWRPCWWRGWTLIPGGWCYDLGGGLELSVGEWESQCGPIFGRRVLVVRPPRPRRYRVELDWEPSECDECGYELHTHWTSYPYHYRCCYSCWNVIQHQLWHCLEDNLSIAPANIVWPFLLEPASR